MSACSSVRRIHLLCAARAVVGQRTQLWLLAGEKSSAASNAAPNSFRDDVAQRRRTTDSGADHYVVQFAWLYMYWLPADAVHGVGRHMCQASVVACSADVVCVVQLQHRGCGQCVQPELGGRVRAAAQVWECALAVVVAGGPASEKCNVAEVWEHALDALRPFMWPAGWAQRAPRRGRSCSGPLRQARLSDCSC